MWLIVAFVYTVFLYNCAGYYYPGLDGYLTANLKTVADAKTVTYVYYEGEPVNVSCTKSMGYWVHMSYTTKDGIFFSTDYQQKLSVNMYIKLKAASNNDTILKCMITDEEKIKRRVVAIHFIVGTRKEQAGFEVNGLLLPRMSYSNVLEYQYQYYRGEPITFRVIKNDNLYKDEDCRFRNHISFSDYSSKGDIYYLQANGTKTFLFTCTFHRRDDNSEKDIILTFFYNPPDVIKELSVDQLSTANILVKLSNVTNQVILYEYKEQENIAFTCAHYQHNVIWNCSPNIYGNCTLQYNTRNGTAVIDSFAISNNLRNAVIYCIEENTSHTIFIDMIREKKIGLATSISIKPENRTTADTTPESPVGNATETTPTITSTSGVFAASKSITENSVHDIILPIVGVLALIIVAVIIGATIHYVRKIRLKKRGLRSNLCANNVSLPGQNEEPMTLPSQWVSEEVTYAVPDCPMELLYAKPIPKNQRTKPEDLYSQPLDAAEHTYATVQESCEQYAEISENHYSVIGNS